MSRLAFSRAGGRATYLAPLVSLVVLLAGCSDPATERVSAAELRRALPSAETIGAVFGSTTMERTRADGGDLGFDDTYGRPDPCDALLGELDGAGSLSDVTSGGPGPHVEGVFVDDAFTEVTITMGSGENGAVRSIERFIEACDRFGVRGPSRSSIREVRYDSIDPVPVKGDAVAFEQTVVYTDVDNVYLGQAWRHDGVTILVIAFSGLDDQRRPTRLARSEFEELVHRIDREVAEVLDR